MSVFRDLFNVKQSPILSMLGFGGGGTGTALKGGASLPGTLTIKMWAASGGGWQTKGWGSPTPGSAGGAVSVTNAPYEELGISSGDTLKIYVGGTCNGNSGGSNGGHPGGGASGAGPGRGGGGMTAIYKGPHSTGTRMLIAGGSGGSSVMSAFGWYPTGYPSPSNNNQSSPPFNAPNGPGGGTQNFGGSGSRHPHYPSGSPGGQFNGGSGSGTGNGAAGGGGAGWYGGGGGHGDTGAANGSGGSGGSNWQGPTINATVTHHNDFQDVPGYMGVGPNSGWNFSTQPWPSFWQTFYPAFGPASNAPGFNSQDPDYSFPRSGGTNDGPSNGQPGSVVIIDVDGNKTTFTHTGSEQSYTVP